MLTAILGQLVSVSFGRTLTRELIEAAGTKANHPRTGDFIRLFPTAKQLLKADLSKVRTSGEEMLSDLSQHLLRMERSSGINRLNATGCVKSFSPFLALDHGRPNTWLCADFMMMTPFPRRTTA